jgi:phenylpyruvate tautomerase PptA (4-oxalocrotonate tautomerase family)
MPLHRIFVPTGLYTLADKAAFAQAITDVYAVLPPFYVVVLFIDLEPSNFFVGGKSTDRMVRINVEHVARNFAEYVGSPSNFSCLSCGEAETDVSQG